MSQPSSRQELYDRIRKSSKDEVILKKMIRLGFWPSTKGQPKDPADEIRRRGELQRRLAALRTEQSRLHNIAAQKREARKRRLAEARRKRQETKERRLRERAERAARWRERKKQDIVYLGPGVSAGLGNNDVDATGAERLARAGLPALVSAADVAGAMGITVGELRFLAFSRITSRVTHYARFKIPKRTGGERLISAPMPRLAAAQRWILANILARLEPHDAAHGFRAGRSIVSNARPHVGSDVVVNLDLEDFFPTVSYRRVKGLFRHMGYSEAAATLLALLCTEPEVAEVELDGVTYYVHLGHRFLPQGAPTSPAITNLLCRRLDRRLRGASQKLGFTYTRYADDLTFSGSGAAADRVGRLLRQVGWIVAEEGFVVHPRKTRVLRKGRRQEVTGVVVNQRPAIARDTLRRFRATLYQIEKDGPEGKTWGSGGDVITSILGFASYVAMVDPEKGAELVRRTRALAAKHGAWPPRGAGRPSGRASGEVRIPADAPASGASSPGDGTPDGDGTPGSDGTPDGDGKKAGRKWWKLF